MTEIALARLDTSLAALASRMDRFEKHVTDQQTETNAILRSLAEESVRASTLKEAQASILENQQSFRDKHLSIQQTIRDYQTHSDARHNELERKIDNLHSMAKPIIWFLGIVVPLTLTALGTLFYMAFFGTQ